MHITLEMSVRALDSSDYGKNYEFVGELKINGKFVTNKFICGAYAFSNPYSANMFSYLFRTYDSQTAKSAVSLFEKKMVESNAKKAWDFVSLDWKEILKGGLKKAIDWKGIVMDLAVALAGLGFRSIMLESVNPELNPYSAKQDEEQYVAYALAYWHKNPMNGPAYRIRRY